MEQNQDGRIQDGRQSKKSKIVASKMAANPRRPPSVTIGWILSKFESYIQRNNIFVGTKTKWPNPRWPNPRWLNPRWLNPRWLLRTQIFFGPKFFPDPNLFYELKFFSDFFSGPRFLPIFYFTKSVFEQILLFSLTFFQGMDNFSQHFIKYFCCQIAFFKPANPSCAG